MNVANGRNSFDKSSVFIRHGRRYSESVHLLDLLFQGFCHQLVLLDHSEASELDGLHEDLVHRAAASGNVGNLNVGGAGKFISKKIGQMSFAVTG